MRLVEQEKLDTKKMSCVEVPKEEGPKVRYASLLWTLKYSPFLRTNGHLANRETMKDRGRVAECGETSLCCRLFSKHLGVHVEVGALEEYEEEEMHQGWEGLRRGELQNKNSSTFIIFFHLKDQCNVGFLIIDPSTFVALHWAERRTWWWWWWWWSPGESRKRSWWSWQCSDGVLSRHVREKMMMVTRRE